MSTLFLMDRGWRPFARLPPAARLGTGRSREGLIPSLRLSELAAFILLPMYYAQLRPALPPKHRKAWGSARDGVAMRLRLAGVKPNSDAIRIMISACRFAIATYGDCTGYPEGDLIMVPLSLSETYALKYWWCSPPRTGIASVRPTVWTARGIGASLCSDRCVRASL